MIYIIYLDQEQIRLRNEMSNPYENVSSSTDETDFKIASHKKVYNFLLYFE